MADARRDVLLEAFSLGAGTFLAANAAGVTMVEFNLWLQDAAEGYAWRERVRRAESAGKEYRAKIQSLRGVVERYDEAWSMLERRAEHFEEFKKKQRAGTQLGLLT